MTGALPRFGVRLHGGLAPRRCVELAAAAIVAIIKKKYALSMLLQRLPSQPAMKLPVKLVASQTPIIIDSILTGASLETSERPIGEM